MADLAPLDFWPQTREWLRKLAQSANAALTGSNITVGEVTLNASATTTTVTDPRVTESSHITLTPLTANAQADFIAGMRISARTNETSFTITHPSDSDVDKTFTYMINNP